VIGSVSSSRAGSVADDDSRLLRRDRCWNHRHHALIGGACSRCLTRLTLRGGSLPPDIIEVARDYAVGVRTPESLRAGCSASSAPKRTASFTEQFHEQVLRGASPRARAHCNSALRARATNGFPQLVPDPEKIEEGPLGSQPRRPLSEGSARAKRRSAERFERGASAASLAAGAYRSRDSHRRAVEVRGQARSLRPPACAWFTGRGYFQGSLLAVEGGKRVQPSHQQPITPDMSPPPQRRFASDVLWRPLPTTAAGRAGLLRPTHPAAIAAEAPERTSPSRSPTPLPRREPRCRQPPCRLPPLEHA